MRSCQLGKVDLELPAVRPPVVIADEAVSRVYGAFSHLPF